MIAKMMRKPKWNLVNDAAKKLLSDYRITDDDLDDVELSEEDDDDDYEDESND